MRARLVLAILLGLAALAPAGARARPVLGFADQKASMFADRRFVDLHIHQVRLNLPWDALQDPATLAQVDAWMRAARIGRFTPMVTINHSRRPGLEHRDPTAGALATQVRRWRRRWPGQIRQLSTWNEPNLGKSPALVAQWYRAIRRACPTCTVVGADVVDRRNAVSWVQRFVRAAGRSPRVWGLHNYVDANTFSTRNTRAFLRATHGDVWLTETGGVVSRRRPGVRFLGAGSAHAAQATEFLLDRIVRVDPRRLTRVYLYSWSTSATDANWDSGVIGPDGRERPELRVVRCYLGSCTPRRSYAPAPVPPA